MKTIDYKIRSVQLLNYMNDIESGRLVTNPFFQRNLVWRDLHKQEFIKTILLGYPFPHVFLSKGKIDLDKKISIASIVDGQQRTNAIMEFISGKLSVNNRKFSELTDEEKQDFYKYEIPVIELDLTNDDQIIADIFQRINRTSNSLTMIDRKSSEFSASEFMHFSEFISGQMDLSSAEDDEDEEITNIRNNPYIKDSFKDWAKAVDKNKKAKEFRQLMTSQNLFSINEIAKKTNLQYTLNIISTTIGGFFNRNELSWTYAEQYNESFDLKDKLLERLEKSAILFNKLKFKKSSLWYRKANFFSLFVYFCRVINKIDINYDGKVNEIKIIIDSVELSDDYKNAAKEGVNNKKEREIRDIEIQNIFEKIIN
ncbi:MULTISPECIES: GmrSD restriction endonuclease domain-containing protein [Providencia]|uniref:Uncharacterized conserved protein n=3 Tax=Providencia TaxID=586 RepID=A0A9N8CZ20_PRORE|nr:DUF262 domain-containing protein [Providencia rettgeri]CAB5694789.1 Uncharacterized conserved protein [Providencia rettgeri]CAC9214693.1 Uncharacterized conserved protein [Providencia rettgeri]